MRDLKKEVNDELYRRYSLANWYCKDHRYFVDVYMLDEVELEDCYTDTWFYYRPFGYRVGDEHETIAQWCVLHYHINDIVARWSHELKHIIDVELLVDLISEDYLGDYYSYLDKALDLLPVTYRSSCGDFTASLVGDKINLTTTELKKLCLNMQVINIEKKQFTS